MGGRLAPLPAHVAAERYALGRALPVESFPPRPGHVETPQRLPGRRVKGRHEPRPAVPAGEPDHREAPVRVEPVSYAGDAHEHLAIVHQGRRADADAGGPRRSHLGEGIIRRELVRRLRGPAILGHGDVPDRSPARRLQRDQPAVDGADEHLAALDRDAPVRGAAAQLGRPRLVTVSPQLAAGPGVECGDPAERQGDEHHRVEHDRCRLESRRDPAVIGPQRLELGHGGGVDLGERRIPLSAQVQAVQRPACVRLRLDAGWKSRG